MPRFSFGALAVPDDWDVSLQIELQEPARTLPAQTALLPTVHATQAAPATHILVRRAASTSSPAVSADELVRALRTSVASLHAQSPAPVVFEDGAPGVQLELSFQSAPQRAVVQRHVFRMDAGVLTHLCATVHDARALAPLGPLLLSFTPA